MQIRCTRRHLLSSAAGSQTLHTSQNAERKAASAALQGLCGTHFRQANFLDLVRARSHMQMTYYACIECEYEVLHACMPYSLRVWSNDICICR